MKLIVMVPAYNEEKTIVDVIREVPRKIRGFDSVEVLVVDDGSTDKTVEAARRAGADHVIRHKTNQGLGVAFQTGLDSALAFGADVIVNIDADNQYDSREVPKVVEPIVEGKADAVLTYRDVLSLGHMPAGKKYGNLAATFVTRVVSGFNVKDAQSGFRAFSREAALRLNLYGEYTYVQETIIQLVDKRMRIVQVPCEFRKRSGESRLIPNIWSYAKRAGSIILRSYVRYKPLKAFMTVGLTLVTLGMLLGLRYLLYYLTQNSAGHLQSLLLAAILTIVGFQVVIMALIADTIDSNRILSEEILYKLKKNGLEK